MNLHGASLALDTSVVMRLLVQQPVPLYECAARFLEEQLTSGVPAHVSDHVLAEAYYALQAYYHFTKADALQSLALFTQTPGIMVSTDAREVLSLPGLATAKPGFADRLIHGEARRAGHTLVTFEKASRKLTDVLVLPG